MNPLHYPDIERCEQLHKIGFPKTYYTFIDTEHDDYQEICPIMPSVMELLDVIPKEINGEYFRV